MHAFLIVSQGPDTAVEKLATKLKAKVMEFPLAKIDDVRTLNSQLKLSASKPTLIYVQNIDQAIAEAQNAFLKNLEEPGDNIFFALTTTNTRRVLPTIVSRCQIIKITNHKLQITNERQNEIGRFLEKSLDEKLTEIDKIKDRGEAIKFTLDLISFVDSQIDKKQLKYSYMADVAMESMETLKALEANGNVNLQLTKLALTL